MLILASQVLGCDDNKRPGIKAKDKIVRAAFGIWQFRGLTMTDDLMVTDKILKRVKEANPDTVGILIEYVEKELGVSKDEALKIIFNLENEGRLKLTQPQLKIPFELQDYLFSTHAIWFWIIMVLSLITVFSVVLIPERAYPLVYIRYIFGSIFILFLPGYTFIKTLFPTREINNIERIALSIGTSLALVPFVGFLLNYTPWGIRLIPVTFSVLLLTVILTLTGLIREFQEKRIG